MQDKDLQMTQILSSQEEHVAMQNCVGPTKTSSANNKLGAQFAWCFHYFCMFMLKCNIKWTISMLQMQLQKS